MNRVLCETTLGSFELELFEDKAPATVENFLSHVRDGFYDGTIFHRVIPGFVIQGGGMLPGLAEKDSGAPIANEADNGLSNARGTIAMARTSDPHSATCQFFINTVHNKGLDHKAKDASGWGYCVFGQVSNGMDVIDSIAQVETGNRLPHQNVPKEDVIITRMTCSV